MEGFVDLFQHFVVEEQRNKSFSDQVLLGILLAQKAPKLEAKFKSKTYQISLALFGSHFRRLIQCNETLTPKRTSIVVVVRDEAGKVVEAGNNTTSFRGAISRTVLSWVSNVLRDSEFNRSSANWMTTKKRKAAKSAVQVVGITACANNTLRHDLELVYSFAFEQFHPVCLEDALVLNLLTNKVDKHGYFDCASQDCVEIIARIKRNLFTFTKLDKGVGSEEGDFNPCLPSDVVRNIKLYKLQHWAEKYSFRFYRDGFKQTQSILELTFQCTMLQGNLRVWKENRTQDAKLIFAQFWLKHPKSKDDYSHSKFVDHVIDNFSTKHVTFMDDLQRNEFRNNGNTVALPLLNELKQMLPELTELHIHALMKLKQQVLEQVCAVSQPFREYCLNSFGSMDDETLTNLEVSLRSKENLVKLFTQYFAALKPPKRKGKRKRLPIPKPKRPRAVYDSKLLNWEIANEVKKKAAVTIMNHLDRNLNRVLKFLKQVLLKIFPLKSKAINRKMFRNLLEDLFKIVTHDGASVTDDSEVDDADDGSEAADVDDSSEVALPGIDKIKDQIVALLYISHCKLENSTNADEEPAEDNKILDKEAMKFAQNSKHTIKMRQMFRRFSNDLLTIRTMFIPWLERIKNVFKLPFLTLKTSNAAGESEDEEYTCTAVFEINKPADATSEEEESASLTSTVTSQEPIDSTSTAPSQEPDAPTSTSISTATSAASIASLSLIGLVNLLNPLDELLFRTGVQEDATESNGRVKRKAEKTGSNPNTIRKKKWKKGRKKGRLKQGAKRKKRKPKARGSKQDAEAIRKKKKKRAKKLAHRGRRRAAENCSCLQMKDRLKPNLKPISRIMERCAQHTFKVKRQVFLALPTPSCNHIIAAQFIPCSFKTAAMKSIGLDHVSIMDEVSTLLSQRKLTSRTPLASKSFAYDGTSVFVDCRQLTGIKSSKEAEEADNNDDDTLSDGMEAMVNCTFDYFEALDQTNAKNKEKLDGRLCVFVDLSRSRECCSVSFDNYSSHGRQTKGNLAKFNLRDGSYPDKDSVVYQLPGTLTISERELLTKNGTLKLAKRKKQLLNAISLKQPQNISIVHKCKTLHDLDQLLQSKHPTSNSVKEHFNLYRYLAANKDIYEKLHVEVDCPLRREPVSDDENAMDHDDENAMDHDGGNAMDQDGGNAMDHDGGNAMDQDDENAMGHDGGNAMHQDGNAIDNVHSLSALRAKQRNASKFSFGNIFFKKLLATPIVKHFLKKHDRDENDIDFLKSMTVVLLDTKLNFRGCKKKRWITSMRQMNVPLLHISEYRTSLGHLEDNGEPKARRVWRPVKGKCQCQKKTVQIWKVLQDSGCKKKCVHRDHKASRALEHLSRSWVQRKCKPIGYLSDKSVLLRRKAVEVLESQQQRETQELQQESNPHRDTRQIVNDEQTQTKTPNQKPQTPPQVDLLKFYITTHKPIQTGHDNRAMSTSSSPRKRKRAESADSDKLAHVSPAIQLEERWSVIQETFESIYTGVDGYATARDVRKRLRNEGRYEETETLQYGEIDPVAFCKLLVKLPITGNESKQVFLDIGSGTGKPVIAAAMLPEIFETCAGIEIVSELHESAIASLDRLKGMEKKIVAKCPEFQSEQIRLCCGDSFKLMSDSSKVDDKRQVEFPNIRDVDVLFAPTTCFTDELMLKLDHLVDRCKTGCVVITTTRKLTNSKCELKFEERIKYGRGSLNFLVYKIVKTKQVTNSSTPKVAE